MTPEPVFEPLLSPEPVLAWRVWGLARSGSELTLRAITRPDEWPAQDAMRAKCPSHGTPIPRLGCSCGLYAAATPKDLGAAGVFGMGASVVGAVAMWGTVVEHATGWRAQFAYPARLRLACTTCLSSGRGAVEPAHVVDRGGNLLAYCKRHLSPVPSTALPADRVQAELLSTYAVELLPIERVRTALRRPGTRLSGSSLGPPYAPARVLELALIGVLRVVGFLISAFMFLMFASVVFAFVAGVIGGVVGAFRGTEPSPSAAVAVAAPSLDLAQAPTSGRAVGGFEPHHRVVPPPLPAVGIVCGMEQGRAVDIVPCTTRGEVLLGFAEQSPPKGPRSDCVSHWDAYSQGEDFSICWIALPRFGFIHPWLRSPDPFTVPKEEGGLRDGDR